MISIIIPLYNKEKTITKTLQSIVNQSIKDWECVVVDDGSTDNSAVVVKHFFNKRIHYYYKSNGGVSAARNFGVNNAKGDYILYLDADDVLLPNCIELFLNHVKMNPQYDIYCGNFYIEKNGTKKLFTSNTTNGSVNDVMKHLYRHKIYMRPGAYIIKKEKALQNSFDDSLSRYEDTEIQFRYAKTCKVYSIENPVMIYQCDDNTLSVRVDKYEKDFLSRLYFGPSMGLWEKLYSLNLMYIAIRNYDKNIVAKYYKYLPQIMLSKIISLFIG